MSRNREKSSASHSCNSPSRRVKSLLCAMKPCNNPNYQSLFPVSAMVNLLQSHFISTPKFIQCRRLVNKFISRRVNSSVRGWSMDELIKIIRRTEIVLIRALMGLHSYFKYPVNFTTVPSSIVPGSHFDFAARKFILLLCGWSVFLDNAQLWLIN